MKYICSILLFCQSIVLSAQPWIKPSIVSVPNNFYGIQKQFHEFWENRLIHGKEEENAEEGGYQQFARWEYFMSARSYPSGKIPDPDILLNEYERTKAERNGGQQVQTANWSFIGPHVVPGSGGGAGRINCMAFHPTNNDIIYVGAACGGIWKTYDGGQTWASTTDQLTSISIADIAIDPLHPETLFVATGDGYGYEVGGNIFWGGTYTAGVMKSTDGGLTWSQSGLAYNQTQSEIIQRIIINPEHPDTLLACTRNAIFRTADGAASWTQVQSGHFYDMEFNPLNANTVYAANNNRILRSLNSGLTFQIHSNILTSNGRTSISVTPADTTIMYAFTQGNTFYRSTNGGQTFVSQTAPNGAFYGYYDCVLEASPVDPMRAVVGGLNVFMTANGGLTWNMIENNNSNDYVHADKHALSFLPGSDSIIFCGNDGGFFKTTDRGASWFDLSNGLAIKQYYRMSSSPLNPDLVYAGAQDNGTDQLKNGIWTQVTGGDGMDCLADYNDENTAYTSSQYGNFSISTDGGQSFNGITPSGSGGGDWITPIVQDPDDPNTIYLGYTDLFKSTNKGTTWSNISQGVFTDYIKHIAIAPSNHDYIYLCNLSEIYMTDNAGLNWTNISLGLPVSSTALTDITVSSADPQHIWVTFSGYNNGTKVFYSSNGGNTWSNFSGSLPNIPVNCIVYQINTNDELYIGTDFGVYYTNATLSDWIPYQNGLPNVIVDDVEVNYTVSKLRAATYGRGLWESDLNTTTLFSTDAGVSTISSPAGLTCASIFNPEIVIRNYGVDTLVTLDLNYKLDNAAIQTQVWTGVLPSGQLTTVNLSSLTAGAGQHTFTVFTNNPNGISDGNPLNDQKISSFEIDNVILSYPVIEGFEGGSLPLPDWRIMGAQSLLSIQPVGGFGMSSYSIMADFYNIASAKTYLTSRRIDLTNASSQVLLGFNVAYAQYSSQYHDTLTVGVSTDCGETWTNVYSKTASSLETAPATQNEFTPLPSEWRAESINLDAWIGFPEVMVRFGALSGYGNKLYVDDINLNAGIPVGLFATDDIKEIRVYPVPFNQTLNIDALSEKLTSLQLTDITGKVIIEQFEINAHKRILNMEKLSSGTYFLKISTSNRVIVKKVVKK